MTTKRVDVSGPGFSDDDSPPASNLSSMQRAIVTIQKMRAKIEGLERTRTEPIAIIGMACRIPGGANTPEAFFRLLEDGVDAVTEVPPERWRVEPEGPNSEGEARALRWGAFLKDADLFDASFFGISPREAESLDPQHRLLLEVTWEALERAGQLPERLLGTKAGVFVGIWAPDYQLRVLARDPNELDAYCFTGTVLSTAAGRLSYTLGVQGPCVSIDTACSSSLTAIHLACQSLRNGESSMAIAGGVNMMLAPTTSKLLSKTQALSPDGRCKTFDARANGYVRGEGCGMLILKRLSDAEKDGDTILALIRGSAVNQDGRSTGLTAPNVLSQQALLRQALENARLAPQDIAYLETHGTGTSLGDPIEVEAIKAVLGAPRERGASCVLGALKSNIGHLEAAAGVAGVIKVVLALQNEKIPANLHFRSLNPRIDLRDTSLEIAQTAQPWAPGIRPRYAGVSSFGISGTNAHVIVEEAPRNLEEALLEEPSTCLLPVSAKTPEALRAHAQAFREMLQSDTGPRLVDIVHTASARRSHYVHRLAVVGQTKDELAQQLDAYLRNELPSGTAMGKASPARAKVVFVFSGQGSQWLGMGRQLYETDASFRSVIDTCDNLMTSRLNWSILDELDAPEAMSRMGETQVAQPLLFAVQVALVEMLRSWGISPDAMIGHSVGEIAAAHVAGILSLDEAIRLVAIRGRIMQKATGMGKMVSVSMTPEEAQTILAGYEDRVSIAAINDPGSIVLSGSTQSLEDVILRCEKRGYATRALRVDYAFHSPQMDSFEHELVERLARVDTRRATLAMYSTVLADCVDGKELDVRYWGRNIRQTVDFTGAVFAALRDGYQLFLEISPHPVLTNNIQQCLLAKNADGAVNYTMRRQQDQRRTLLEAVGTLYTRGCFPEWSRVVPSGGKTVPLPTYPWQRQRHWLNLGTDSSDHRFTTKANGRYALAGTPSDVPGDTLFQVIEVGPARQAYLTDHVVHGHVVIPAAFYVATVLAVAAERFNAPTVTLRDVVFVSPLVVKNDVELHVALRPRPANVYEFTVLSKAKSLGGVATKFQEHVTGQLVLDAQPLREAIGRSDIFQKAVWTGGADGLYNKLLATQIDWGSRWRWVRDVGSSADSFVASLVPALAVNLNESPLHPILIDNVFVAAFLQPESAANDLNKSPRLPFAFKELRWFGLPISTARVLFQPAAGGARETTTGDLTLVSESGAVVCEIDGFTLKRAPRESFFRELADGLSFLPDFLPSATAAQNRTDLHGTRWLVFTNATARAEILRNHLEHAGAQLTVVPMFHNETSPPTSHEVARYFDTMEQVSGRGELSGILCWWSGSVTPIPEAILPLQVEQTAFSGLHVMRAFMDFQRQHPTSTSLRWFWVTENSQPAAGTSTLSLELASLWGLGRVLQQEHPEFALKLVDVDVEGDDSIAAIEEEIAVADDEMQVVRRGRRRFVPRLVRRPMPEVKRPNTQPLSNGTVLITGGLGALGLRVANWVWHEHHAGHIVLVGRTLPSTSAAEEIARLRESGANVTISHADVNDGAALAGVLATLPKTMPLRGIVHASGVLDDGTLTEQTDARFSKVLAPKVGGAWNLHLLTREMPLDFFVLFSSTTSMNGNAGQSNYASANAFLDGLAHARRMLGLPALAINWGPWAGGGMASSLSEVQRMRLLRGGMNVLSPERALAAMNLALSLSDPQVAIFAFDASMQGSGHEFRVPAMWRGLLPSQRTTRDTQKGAASSSATWSEQLAHLNEADRKAHIENAVCQDAARVLRLGSPDQVQMDRPLQEQGFDSLMSVELRNTIASRVGQMLSPTLVFDYPTPRAIAKYLFERVLKTTPPAPVEAPAPAPRPSRVSTVEPIAIVGMGCRYPGGVHDPESFWKLLEQGEDAIRVIPRERWDVDPIYDPDPGAPGKMYSRESGMLEKIDSFDAAFFGISAREAIWMDPQQRLLLETTWEALENAGLTAEQLMGSDTGVFVGLMYHEYASLGAAMLDTIEGHATTGSAGSVASGRISYVFGLQGPSLTVDTACSSSLVSLHLACRSLRARDCSIALAGGVALMLTPTTHVEFSRLRALARDGRCKSFDASADGVSWAEGCGMLVLKRLSDAERDGDSILAIVVGSAVNQDGRSNGLTAPNGPSQEAVIRRALDDAGLKPSDIDYIEGHGTGTPLGDPIEVQALGAVYGESRATHQPILLGSVKSNIGHSQSAAGAAGIMKVVLSLQHDLIPPSLHFHDPNPRVEWSRFSLKVVSEAVPWTPRTTPRRAGVSSFGISGTNAHVILEEAPRPAPLVRKRDARAYLLPLSAKSPEALRALAASYEEWFARENNEPLADVMYTASVRRTHHEHRLAAVASSHEEFAEMLGAFVRGESPAGVLHGKAPSTGSQRLVFVFSGQGSQWAGMGKALLDTEPVFRAKVEQIDTLVRNHAEFSVLDELRALEDTSRLGETEVVQPALFALQVGLVELLKSWGILPRAVIGHSVGEVAAAHVSGAISLEEAVRLVVLRGRIMQKATGLGKMVWVGLPRDLAEMEILGLEDKIAIAAINDPSSVVLSGETKALDALVALLENRGIATRPLRVNYAFHSPQMDSLASEFAAQLGRFTSQTPTTTLYSTVTGGRIESGSLGTEYWAGNVRSTVDLVRAVNAALDEGPSTLVEVGPHPVLLANLEQCAAEKNVDVRVVSTLRRQGDAIRIMLQSVGALHTAGLSIAWRKLLPEGGRVISLPAYSWQRERYWIPLPNTQTHLRPETGLPVHDGASSASNDKFASCLFQVAWQRADLGGHDATAKTKRHHWLVFEDARGLGATLAKQLRANGDRVTEVSAAVGYARCHDDSYQLDPTNLAHWEQLLGDAFGKEGCHGVLHCAALDCASWSGTTAATLALDLRRAPLATLRLAQALTKQGWRDTPRLYIVTRAAQAVGAQSTALSVAQSTLWGLGRVIAMELPDLGCIRIDLPPEADPNEGAFVLRELAESGAENQVALRGGARYVARLERGSWTKNEVHFESTPLHSDKTYVITGGLGGLGLSLAKWMVERGARHLVLLGRSAPNATAERAIREMESTGAAIHALRANVAQRADVDAVMSHIAEHMPALRGIVHAAAVLADRTLSEMNDVEFFRAVEPKVLGAWNLHEATQQHTLDFFVVYSSVAGLLGSPGQANYAAANTFLDALCQARKAQGLAGTSIQWGPFADVGLAAADDLRGKRLAARGNTSFTPEDGNTLFERVLVRAPAEVALMHFDVRQWVQFYPQMAGAPFLANMMRAEDTTPATQGPRFLDELALAPGHERLNRLTKHVLDALGQVLRIDPSKIDKGVPFTNLGMDSLMSLELRNRFEATLGVKLSAALLFTYPTTAKLVTYLLERIEKVENDAPGNKPRVEEPTNDIAPAVEEPLMTASGGEESDDLLALFDASAAQIRRENLK